MPTTHRHGEQGVPKRTQLITIFQTPESPLHAWGWSTITTLLKSRGIPVSAALQSQKGPLNESSDSDTDKDLACRGWYLHVGSPFTCSRSPEIMRFSPLISTGRWDFAIHLSYEWSIIRGIRPYKPTIWVRGPFVFVI